MYCPLVDCIPLCIAGGCTCPGGTCHWGGGQVYLPRGFLPGDVSAWGCTCLGGVPAWGVPARRCTCLGGVPVGGVPTCGVYLPGGCTCLGGVPAWGYLPRYSPCEQNDRQVQKYYLAPNFVCGQ